MAGKGSAARRWGQGNCHGCNHWGGLLSYKRLPLGPQGSLGGLGGNDGRHAVVPAAQRERGVVGMPAAGGCDCRQKAPGQARAGQARRDCGIHHCEQMGCVWAGCEQELHACVAAKAAAPLHGAEIGINGAHHPASAVGSAHLQPGTSGMRKQAPGADSAAGSLSRARSGRENRELSRRISNDTLCSNQGAGAAGLVGKAGLGKDRYCESGSCGGSWRRDSAG